MSKIGLLRDRARRSRKSGFAAPIVTTMEEAQELAQAIADQLTSASPDEVMLCLAALTEIQTALEARMKRLEAEMAETRQELGKLRQGSHASLSYATTASLAPTPRKAH